MFSPFFLVLFRPFMAKETYETMKSFISPLISLLVGKNNDGVDWLLYDAPLALYFHTSPYSDPVDPLITATYAMLAAETLGLGSCMIGTVGPLMQYSKKLKEKYGIPVKNQQGIMLILGYPAIKYRKSLKRRLAAIKYY